MPKFLCNCGHTINLSNGWSDDEFLLIPEEKIDEIGASLGDGMPMSTEDFFNKIDGASTTVYRCPVCRRLHLEGNDGRFISYVLEE